MPNKKLKTFTLLLLLLSWGFSPATQAYESAIHFYLTYITGYWCGLTADSAQIALADYSVDAFPETDPGSNPSEWLDFSKMTTRRIYHFAVPKDSSEKVVRGSKSAWETAQYAIQEASPNNVNTVMLGIGLHTLQDSYSHEGYAPRFGHVGNVPDLPETDPQKMVQAAEATWIALNEWSLKTKGTGCSAPFSSMGPQLESWAKLALDSDFELSSAWGSMITKITGVKFSPETGYQATSYHDAFMVVAKHVFTLKDR